MADPTPLLVEEEPPKLAALKSPEDIIDSVINDIVGDEFSLTVFIRAALVSFAWFFDAQHAFVTVFADADPTWHFTDGASAAAHVEADVCQLPRGSWAWDLPARASTVSEWGLHCAGTLAAGAPASAFFAGSLLGGLTLALLADSWLGRKRVLFLSCLVSGSAAFLTALSPGLLVYSALRFAAGFGRAAIGTCALVLPTELVGRRCCGSIGVLGFVSFTLGFLSLPGMAYLNRGQSWRNLYVFVSVMTVVYSVCIHFFVTASPRWLLVRGRKQEAEEALAKIAGQRDKMVWNLPDIPLGSSELSVFSAVKSLISKPWALRRLLAVMALGFGIGMVYYGMPLSLGSLPISLYLSATINALAEFPASAATYFLVAKAGRKPAILFLTVSSGILSAASAAPAGWPDFVRVGLEVVSFFAACTASNMMLILTVELFPTVVRNSAVAAVRQAVVVGSVVAPLLASAGRGGQGLLSFGVFGAAIAISGMFVCFLPETRGKVLCDTMEDEEGKHDDNVKTVR